MKQLFALAALAALLSGCISVERSRKTVFDRLPVEGTPGTPEEHVHVSNYGYYLFNSIPLFCGDASKNGTGNTVFFRDDVTLAKMQNVLLEEVSRRPYSIVEIQPKTSSTCFFSVVPYVGNTFGIFWYKEIQISAVMVKRPTEKKEVLK